MGYSTVRTRDWAVPLMVFVIFLATTAYNDTVWIDWSRWVGYGMTLIFGAWGTVNFVRQALAVFVDALRSMKLEEYRLSGNYLADQIRTMNSEQLQTLRMYGSAVIQWLVTDGDDGPVGIIYGTEVSLAFAAYFLSKSNERQTCPIRNFMDGTYHWDWTGENRIQDRRQAREFTSWLVRNGYAKTMNGNVSCSWVEYMAEDGTRGIWSPAKVLGKLGAVDDGEDNAD